MILYADMLFLVNLIMNVFVLWVVSKATRNKQKKRWLFAGAGVMSLMHTLLIAIEALRFVNVALSSVVILMAGVLLTFRPSGIKAFVKLMLVSYCISFAVGGLGMSLFFLTGVPYAIYFIANDVGFTQAISWQLVLAGMAASYVLIKLGLKILERHGLKRQMLCNVQIFVGEVAATFEALVDTGHSLKDPLSQSPVIIAEFEHVKEFLPDGLKVLFYEKRESVAFSAETAEESTFYKRIRMIPFTSLGRSNGMLIGFRPDSVMVEGAKKPSAVIGIYNDKLCRDGRYQGLLSPELVSL